MPSRLYQNNLCVMVTGLRILKVRELKVRELSRCELKVRELSRCELKVRELSCFANFQNCVKTLSFGRLPVVVKVRELSWKVRELSMKVRELSVSRTFNLRNPGSV